MHYSLVPARASPDVARPEINAISPNELELTGFGKILNSVKGSEGEEIDMDDIEMEPRASTHFPLYTAEVDLSETGGTGGFDTGMETTPVSTGMDTGVGASGSR